jgi:hypothetical protein
MSVYRIARGLIDPFLRAITRRMVLRTGESTLSSRLPVAGTVRRARFSQPLGG